jgi:hypothetical protein
MARVAPDIAEALAGDPAVRLQAIVTAASDLDSLLAVLTRDITVTHQYRLLRGIAVEAPAGALRQLVRSKAVASIEPVRDVTHQ